MLAVGATSAGSAVATTSPLFIMSEGKNVSPGTPVTEESGITLNGKRENGQELCFEQWAGTLGVDAKATDKFVFTEGGGTCQPEATILAGQLVQAALTSAGKLTLTYSPKLALRITGPCVYEASKLTGSINLFGVIQGHASAVGALNAATSSRTCSRTARIEAGPAEEFPVQFVDLNTHLLLEDEIFT